MLTCKIISHKDYIWVGYKLEVLGCYLTAYQAIISGGCKEVQVGAKKPMPLQPYLWVELLGNLTIPVNNVNVS